MNTHTHKSSSSYSSSGSGSGIGVSNVNQHQASGPHEHQQITSGSAQPAVVLTPEEMKTLRQKKIEANLSSSAASHKRFLSFMYGREYNDLLLGIAEEGIGYLTDEQLYELAEDSGALAHSAFAHLLPSNSQEINSQIQNKAKPVIKRIKLIGILQTWFNRVHEEYKSEKLLERMKGELNGQGTPTTVNCDCVECHGRNTPTTPVFSCCVLICGNSCHRVGCSWGYVVRDDPESINKGYGISGSSLGDYRLNLKRLREKDFIVCKQCELIEALFAAVPTLFAYDGSEEVVNAINQNKSVSTGVDVEAHSYNHGYKEKYKRAYDKYKKMAESVRNYKEENTMLRENVHKLRDAEEHLRRQNSLFQVDIDRANSNRATLENRMTKVDTAYKSLYNKYTNAVKQLRYFHNIVTSEAWTQQTSAIQSLAHMNQNSTGRVSQETLDMERKKMQHYKLLYEQLVEKLKLTSEAKDNREQLLTRVPSRIENAIITIGDDETVAANRATQPATQISPETEKPNSLKEDLLRSEEENTQLRNQISILQERFQIDLEESIFKSAELIVAECERKYLGILHGQIDRYELETKRYIERLKDEVAGLKSVAEDATSGRKKRKIQEDITNNSIAVVKNEIVTEHITNPNIVFAHYEPGRLNNHGSYVGTFTSTETGNKAAAAVKTWLSQQVTSSETPTPLSLENITSIWPMAIA